MNTYDVQHNYSVRIRRGINGELAVLEVLNDAGRNCVKQEHKCPFDILADGWKLDVKTAVPTHASGQQRWHGERWLFNLHHSGRPITACDFFVLRLEGVSRVNPDEAMHLLLRAPFHAISFAVHTRTFSKALPLSREFDRFLSGDYGICPLPIESEKLLTEMSHVR